MRISNETVISRTHDGTERKALPRGFSLIETLVAVFILTFGLLASGQLIAAVVASTALARSMETAAVAAQSEMERLGELFSRDPSSAELAPGAHGPRAVEFANPSTAGILNRFSVTWSVAVVTDPRVGRAPRSRQVTVNVTPVDENGDMNLHTRLNKELSVAGVFSTRVP